MNAWSAFIAMAAGFVLLWGIMVLTLIGFARRHGDPTGLRDALRLLPDLLRLVRRLASDPSLPRRVRWQLRGLLVYLLLPIDLVPDFIPVVGYADDAIVVAVVLRWVIKGAGAEALDRHWSGTAAGLTVIKRLAGAPVEAQS